MADAERNEWIGSLERARVALVESRTRSHIGIDLAWADTARKKTNESGIVMLDPVGNVAVADWTVGVDETAGWLDLHAPSDSLLFVDAPLVVNNETSSTADRTRPKRLNGSATVASKAQPWGTTRTP